MPRVECEECGGSGTCKSCRGNKFVNTLIAQRCQRCKGTGKCPNKVHK